MIATSRNFYLHRSQSQISFSAMASIPYQLWCALTHSCPQLFSPPTYPASISYIESYSVYLVFALLEATFKLLPVADCEFTAPSHTTKRKSSSELSHNSSSIQDATHIGYKYARSTSVSILNSLAIHYPHFSKIYFAACICTLYTSVPHRSLLRIQIQHQIHATTSPYHLTTSKSMLQTQKQKCRKNPHPSNHQTR